MAAFMEEALLRLRAYAYGSERPSGRWRKTWSPAGSVSTTTSTTM
jgi:hypothetical protein